MVSLSGRTAPMAERGYENSSSGSGRSTALVHRMVCDPPSLPTSVGCTLSVRRSRIADTPPRISMTLRICSAKNFPTAQGFEIAGMQPRPLDQYLLPLVPIQHKPLPSGTKPVPNCIDIHRKQTRVLICLRIDLYIDRRIHFIHREKVPCKRWL